jgi:hypothetical protein
MIVGCDPRLFSVVFGKVLIFCFFDRVAGGKNDVKGGGFDKEALLFSGIFLSGLESSTYKYI